MRHFEYGEFACKCCGRLCPEGMNTKLLEALDDLREKWGDCVMVSSGYRCPAHNAEVGGVPNSQHVQGTAADVYVVSGNYDDFYNLAVSMKRFDGIGHYPASEFVHLDMRDNGESPNYYRWEG